jgi:hypothetical protein
VILVSRRGNELAAAGFLVFVALTPLSQPLPFFAYPFLAATLCGWAWAILSEKR